MSENVRIDDWAYSMQRICKYEREAHDHLNEKNYAAAEQDLRRIMVEARYVVEFCQKRIYGEVPPWD
jgi:hypothetical protein